MAQSFLTRNKLKLVTQKGAFAGTFGAIDFIPSFEGILDTSARRRLLADFGIQKTTFAIKYGSAAKCSRRPSVVHFFFYTCNDESPRAFVRVAHQTHVNVTAEFVSKYKFAPGTVYYQIFVLLYQSRSRHDAAGDAFYMYRKTSRNIHSAFVPSYVRTEYFTNYFIRFSPFAKRRTDTRAAAPQIENRKFHYTYVINKEIATTIIFVSTIFSHF